MIATWRDSWFENGTRLLYLVPRAFVDAILPLDIDPSPRQISRVFIGRVELISPEVLKDVGEALAANDRAALGKRGRFLRPIADRMLARSTRLERAAMTDRLSSAFDWWLRLPSPCS